MPVNRLLASLPPRFRPSFLAGCHSVDLEFGDVLCEPGKRPRYVYFPLVGFISLITELEDGSRLEVGIAGNEGMVGIHALLGVNTALQHAVVQGAGSTLRMATPIFSRHCRDNAELRQLFNRYVYVLFKQLAQVAACAHFHVVEARLARWLLLTRDRAHSNEFRLTHEFLAYLLGVRRVGVTQAASSLHERGLIDYRRGAITVLDPSGLQAAACSCYRESNAIYEQTLGRRRG